MADGSESPHLVVDRHKPRQHVVDLDLVVVLYKLQRDDFDLVVDQHRLLREVSDAENVPFLDLPLT